jgi:fused signal recognition particle receptor
MQQRTDSPQSSTGQSHTPAGTPLLPTDVVGIGLTGVFFALVVGLGVQFVRRKRKESIETLTRELEAAPREAPAAPQDGEQAAQAALEEEESRRALVRSLEKTRQSFFGRLGQLLSGKGDLDPKIVDELEPLLIQADVGVKTTEKLLATVRDQLARADQRRAEKVQQGLRDEILRIVDVPRRSMETRDERPCVVMVVGVNGAGKTTTVGKLAHRLQIRGHKLLLAAGDTFRAAATEQLRIWGERARCQVVEGKEGQDPASVIFDAVKRAVDERADFVLADTAGRLHTKVNLMEELKKVRRVIGKAVDGAPHEVLLVLDATNGQNALIQAEQFHSALDVTGIALTKLDGTAKGGIIIAICDQLRIPIQYVGVGEKLEDLRPFGARAFVDGLFGGDAA